MSGPLQRAALIEGLAAHMAASCGASPAEEDVIAGCIEMAEAAVEYLGGTVKGFPGPPGGLLWIFFTALWEGVVPQSDIDAFFGQAKIDIAKMYMAWKRSKIPGLVTFALIPGELTTAGIEDVAKALWYQRGKPEPGLPEEEG